MQNQSEVVYNKAVKKALIFNPYLDTLGGGEFYSLMVGEFLLKNNYSLEIAWNNKDILDKIDSRFNLNIKNRVQINKEALSILKESKNIIQKYIFTHKYQLIFFVSDGSAPFLFAQQNWLLFQAPFQNVNGQSLLNQIKLKNIHQILCYSNFVKKFIDKEFKIDAQVVYPAIPDCFFNLKPIKKENIILSVGRFDQIMNAKKQDILIEVFKKMVDKGLKGWQLVLAGGLMKKNAYFLRLQKMIRDYPILIKTNVTFQTLFNYYQKAKIYWHAAGFGEDLDLHPERAEHFGISIVEAMACGVLPMVFKAGGPAEIIKDNDLLWQSKQELWQKTNRLIINSDLREKKLKTLKNYAQNFKWDSFKKQLEKLIIT